MKDRGKREETRREERKDFHVFNCSCARQGNKEVKGEDADWSEVISSHVCFFLFLLGSFPMPPGVHFEGNGASVGKETSAGLFSFISSFLHACGVISHPPLRGEVRAFKRVGEPTKECRVGALPQSCSCIWIFPDV